MRDLKSKVVWYQRAQLLLIVGMGVILGLFYVVGYRPMQSRILALRERRIQRQFDLKAVEDKTRILPDIANDVRSLRARLEQSRRLAGKEELPDCIGELNQLGEKSALSNWSIKPESPRRQELFNCQPVSLTFRGDYIDVVGFLRKLDSVQRLMRVRAISITAKDKTQGQVDVQLAMELYFTPAD